MSRRITRREERRGFGDDYLAMSQMAEAENILRPGLSG